MNRGDHRAVLALCAILSAACNNTSTTGDAGDAGDGGQDAGDSGPKGNFCKSIGGSCTGAQGDCCTDLTCQNGTCNPPAPICAGYAEQCSSSVPCCEPAGGDSALLICSPLNDAGLSLCLAPQGGSACNMDSDCPAPFVCASSICNYVSATAFSCNTKGDPGYHTPCQLGDSCLESAAEETALQNQGSAADPCSAVGLVCLYTGSAYVCQTPEAIENRATAIMPSTE